MRLESFRQVIWFDAKAWLEKFQLTPRATAPDGTVSEGIYIQQKHPVSTSEVRGWLDKHGFVIEQHYGTRADDLYCDDHPRMIFWARKVE